MHEHVYTVDVGGSSPSSPIEQLASSRTASFSAEKLNAPSEGCEALQGVSAGCCTGFCTASGEPAAAANDLGRSQALRSSAYRPEAGPTSIVVWTIVVQTSIMAFVASDDGVRFRRGGRLVPGHRDGRQREESQTDQSGLSGDPPCWCNPYIEDSSAKCISPCTAS